MTNNFELSIRTTGVVQSYDGYTGVAQTIYPDIAADVVVPVDGMMLARQGIDLTPNHVFSAEINPEAILLAHIFPRAFMAMEQPRPNDSLNSGV